MKTIIHLACRGGLAAVLLALAAGCTTAAEPRPVSSKNISSGLVVQKEAPTVKAPPKKGK